MRLRRPDILDKSSQIASGRHIFFGWPIQLLRHVHRKLHPVVASFRAGKRKTIMGARRRV
jgi:hypothetical protein